MLSIPTSNEWRATHPGAVIGLLELSHIENIHSSARLDERKREAEAYMRERYQGFSRQDFLALPVMSAYDRYYKRFNKTYHVQLQVESIVSRGKSLPCVAPLVDANFIAEMETFVLTAAHDVAKLQGSMLGLLFLQGLPTFSMWPTPHPVFPQKQWILNYDESRKTSDYSHQRLLSSSVGCSWLDFASLQVLSTGEMECYRPLPSS